MNLSPRQDCPVRRDRANGPARTARRLPGLLLPLLLPAVLWIFAPPTGAAAAAADTYLDPLAYTRIDAQAPVVNLVVEQRGTRQTSSVAARRLLVDSRELYICSADLSMALQAARLWQDTLRRLDLDVGGHVFSVTGGSRVVLSARGEALLPVPVLDHGGDLWLPLVALLQVIGPEARLDAAFDAGAGRLTLGRSDDNVEGLAFEILGHSTAVHIRCRDPLAWTVERPRPDVVEATLTGGRADAAALARTEAMGLVRGVEARQESDRVIVTLRLGDLAGSQRAYTADGGREIVIVVEETQAASLPAPVPAGEVELAITPPASTSDDARVGPLRTVIIDPGHGGADTGAVGRQGIMEKDVNLAVARELKQYLERNDDLKVVLTRQRDESLDLDARAEAANVAGGDLFISLHCNSWFDDQATGFETYFLSPASSDWARSVEAAENGEPSAAAREPGDVEFIVWELVQNRFITRSSQFAEFMQTRACAELGLPDRDVRQAGFRVLVGAYMPAVLIEMGFLSNAKEELRLGERGYQKQMARVIGDAVLAFRHQAALAGAGLGSAP